jgi:hypothetical protein
MSKGPKEPSSEKEKSKVSALAAVAVPTRSIAAKPVKDSVESFMLLSLRKNRKILASGGVIPIPYDAMAHLSLPFRTAWAACLR